MTTLRPDSIEPLGDPRYVAWRAAHPGRVVRGFHGTAGHEGEFDPAMVGAAHVDLEQGAVFCFAEDRKNSVYYAKSRAKQTRQAPVILECFIAFANPLKVDFEGTGIETLADDLDSAREDGHDGLIAIDYDDGPGARHATHYFAFDPAQIYIHRRAAL